MNTPPVEPRQAGNMEPSGEDTRTVGDDPADWPAVDFLGSPHRPDSLGRLGHYEVLEVLGKGGFGIVFRAFDEVLQRIVAIKVLSQQMAATSPARKRFLREARSAAQVRHENVVQIHAVEEQPLPYLVMEFVPGETLQQRLDRIGPLDPEEVVVIGRQVADALAAAHAVGLIHRDIKPGNILVETGPRLKIKVTDFGLARAADDASLTQSGAVVGTPLYMSPEQARGDKLDHRSDLFSLGSVLYAITAGRPPFRAENSLAIMKRVAEDAARPIPEVIPETPAWLCRLIDLLMAKNLADRFQSATEVAAALEAGPAAPPNPRHGRLRSRTALRAAAVTLLAVGVTLLGLWATGVFRPRKDLDAPPAGEPIPPTAATADGKPSDPPHLGSGGFRFVSGGVRTRPQVGRDGKLVAAPCGPGVTLFDFNRGEMVRTLDSPGGDVRGIALSPEGKRLAAFCRGTTGQVRVWNLDDDQVLFTRNSDRTIDYEPVFSPDGRWLVVAQNETAPRLQVLDAYSGAEVKSVPTTTWYSGRFNPTGTRFAATFRNPSGVRDIHPDQDKVTVWDTADWREVATLRRPLSPNSDKSGMVQFSPSGKYLAALGYTGITVWHADSLKPAGAVVGNCFWFDFLADEETLLVQCTDDQQASHRFARFDIASGEERGAFAVSGPRDHLYVALDPLRRYLFVSPYRYGTRLRVFDVKGSELLPGERWHPPAIP